MKILNFINYLAEKLKEKEMFVLKMSKYSLRNTIDFFKFTDILKND